MAARFSACDSGVTGGTPGSFTGRSLPAGAAAAPRAMSPDCSMEAARAFCGCREARLKLPRKLTAPGDSSCVATVLRGAGSATAAFAAATAGAAGTDIAAGTASVATILAGWNHDGATFFAAARAPLANSEAIFSAVPAASLKRGADHAEGPWRAASETSSAECCARRAAGDAWRCAGKGGPCEPPACSEAVCNAAMVCGPEAEGLKGLAIGSSSKNAGVTP
mmetsp:Transcript_19088/g.43354  ORF Transcript_19088/g.43354 Transcript_19088/m.43354 type:complete len:222 (+) Transcript_19088:200-865(+)